MSEQCCLRNIRRGRRCPLFGMCRSHRHVVPSNHQIVSFASDVYIFYDQNVLGLSGRPQRERDSHTHAHTHGMTKYIQTKNVKINIRRGLGELWPRMQRASLALALLFFFFLYGRFRLTHLITCTDDTATQR